MNQDKREKQRLAVQRLSDAIATYNKRIDAGLRGAAADHYWNYVLPAMEALEALGIRINQSPNPLDVGVRHISASMKVNF